MLIDKTHIGWGLASAVALAVATAGYWSSIAGGRIASGGSVAGLTFGILSLLAMTFAGLLAVRKKFPAVRFGSAQFWLRGHIWLGLLSLPLAFFHSGFRFGGTLEKVFMILLLAVILSGVYGLTLQQVLPRLLKVRVPLETFPQQIPFLCQRFQEEGDRLIKELEGPAKKSGPPSAARAAAAAGSPIEKPSADAAVVAHSVEGKIPPAGEKSAVVAKALAAKLAAASKPATEKLAAATDAEAGTAPAGGEKSIVAAKILAAKLAAASKLPTEPAAAAATQLAETAGPQSAAKIAAAAALAKKAPSPETPDVPMPRLELLARFYREEVFPFLGSDSRVASRQGLASQDYARMAFANLAVALPNKALAAIHRLEEMVSERRQFLVQVRIQNWLKYWLLIHVPLSAALFAVAAIHVIAALRVVPWT